jgi:two-component system chemotaxis response regulator CheB
MAAGGFQRELIAKIRALGRGRRPLPPLAVSSPAAGIPAAATATASAGTQAAAIALRPLPALAPRVLLIGSSTGGPQALNALAGGIGPVVDRAPVLITQHMPGTFTTVLAEHLGRSSGRVTAEGQDGEPIRAGRIYIAPGGRHMRVERRAGVPVIALNDGPQLNFCRPAVDHLFSSGAAVWKSGVLAVVLTGMGQDGAAGAGDIVAAGGSVIVQDPSSSVVWGMPGSVAHAGLASAVLALDQIGPKLVRLFSGGARDAA